MRKDLDTAQQQLQAAHQSVSQLQSETRAAAASEEAAGLQQRQLQVLAPRLGLPGVFMPMQYTAQPIHSHGLQVSQSLPSQCTGVKLLHVPAARSASRDQRQDAS